MVTVVATAAMMEEACLGVQFVNHDLSREKALMVNQTRSTLQVLSDKLELESNRIDSNFLKWAEDDVHAYAREHTDQGHEQFATDVHDQVLVKKYPWRKWFVASFLRVRFFNTARDFAYAIKPGSLIFHWNRQYERNLVVATPPSQVSYK